MKHSRFDLILLLSAAGLWACNSDPTDSFRESGKRIIADPTIIYVDKGESIFLTVQVVDEQGNQIATDFDATSQSSNVGVERDTTFLATTNGSKIKTSERFSVTGVDYVQSSILVQAGSDTLTVPVSVVPKTTIAATFSDTAPPLGAAVTLTAPAGITFDPTSTVSFGPPPVLEPAEVTVSGDGTTITFIPPPNLVSAPATITNVHSVGSPDLTFTNATADGITTAQVSTLPATFSTLTPSGGQLVTVTFSGASAADGATVDVGGAAGTALDRPTPNTFRFLAPPGAVGLVTINGVVLDAAPQFALSLINTDTMTVDSAVAEIAGTATTATAPSVLTQPALGESTGFFDTGDFVGADITSDGGLGAKYYKFVVTDSSSYHFVTTWVGAAAAPDLDMELCSDAACSDGGDFLGTGIDLPEDDVRELGPGTYYFAVVLFDGTAPPSFSVQITNEGLAPPGIRAAAHVKPGSRPKH
jgi:hypothetical protein